MIRLLEIIVALIIVAMLGVLFGVALPAHRHIERIDRGQLAGASDLRCHRRLSFLSVMDRAALLRPTVQLEP